MHKHFLLFLFLINLIVSYTNCSSRNKLSLYEQYEVEDLALKLTKEKGSVLKGLFDLTSVSGGMNCAVCSFVIDVLKNYLLQKNGFEKFYALVEDICHFTKLDNKVCDGAIDHYKDIVLDSFIRRFVNGDYICSLVNICNDTTEYESIEDFAHRILTNKPQVKEKEIMKRKNDDDYYSIYSREYGIKLFK